MVLGSRDFNSTAGLQFISQRNKLTVHFGPGTLISHFGVDLVGKINRCRTPRQGFDLTAGGKHINFILEQIDANIFQKLTGVPKIFLIFDKIPDPGKFFADIFINPLAFFITPVSGNTGFGNPVHFPGSYLNFDALTKRPDNRGVQRLVHIGLGPGNIIFEFMINRLPHGVNEPQGFITLGDGFENDSKGYDIVDFLKWKVLGNHFVENAEIIFISSQHLAFYIRFLHFFLDVVLDGFHEFFALGAGLGNQRLYSIVFIRLEIFKRAFFQLIFDPVNTEARGNGGVNVQRFPGNFQSLVRLVELQSPHVVEPIGEFDQNNPDIVNHSQKHFPKAFSLAGPGAVKRKTAELGDA